MRTSNTERTGIMRKVLRWFGLALAKDLHDAQSRAFRIAAECDDLKFLLHSHSREHHGLAQRDMMAWRRRWQDRGIGAAAVLALWGLLTALGVA